MNDQRIDQRQSDFIDLSVRLISPLVILWVRPFGSLESGFWPNLIVAVLVSFLAAGALWLYAERRFDPLRGLMTSEPPGRRIGLAAGALAGVATLFVATKALSLPVANQKLRWDDGMLGLAIVLLIAIYVALAVAIWLSGNPAPRPDRPRAADLADLIRRHAALEAIAWLAEEPDDSAIAVVNQLSHSSDPDVRKWIVTNASARLGPSIADLLERVALGDEREDVADAAIDRLVEVAPERAQAFWPSLRARLRSDDQMDVEVAAWKLLAARDPLLSSEIAEVTSTWQTSEYIMDSFRVLNWCLERDRDEIAALIRAQDVTLLPWLIKAAFYLDDGEVWDAIAYTADRGTDHRAKRQYARALRFRYARAVPDLGD
jgi:hypothetical protein